MKQHKHKRTAWISAGLATASLLSGCKKESEQWAAAPGTNGFVNLDAVKEAFQKNPEVADFEKRVNEIFEGDHLIILESKRIAKGFKCTAMEDLDEDEKVSDSDETLFILTVANGRATLQGAGVNEYYKESWKYTPPAEKEDPPAEPRTFRHRHHYFHHWYWGPRYWGGGYYTPRSRYGSIFSHREDYRQGMGFTDQVTANTRFENQMQSQYGSGFRKSVNQPSSLRERYINKTQRSSNFKQMLANNKKTSGWGLRSNSSDKGAFSSIRSKAAKSSSVSSKKSSSSSKGFRGFRGSSGFGI